MKTKTKILFFDIETEPNLGYTWGKYEQNVLSFKSEWQILSFAYKFRGSGPVRCVTRPQFKDATDRSVVIELHKVLSSADILVAHNGDQFDVKKSRARFIAHGLPPLKPLATVDTKKVAKANFNFNSNSLDDLGRYFGIGRKLKHTGFDLWLGCMGGDPASWKLMEKYNKQDVVLLERVYDKMLPWMTTHPTLAPKEACPKCSSLAVAKWGLRAQNANPKQRWLCRSCGGYFLTGVRKERAA